MLSIERIAKAEVERFSFKFETKSVDSDGPSLSRLDLKLGSEFGDDFGFSF